MTHGRTITGNEPINYWQERYGQTASSAPMFSRVGLYSTFSSVPAAGYPIEKTTTAPYASNNILIHSIRCLQTNDEDDATMAIYNNSVNTTDVSASSLVMRWVINRQSKKNNTFNIDFPIPLFLQGGGRIDYDESPLVSGPVVTICYTVLDSQGALPNAEYTFLSSCQQSVDGALTTHVDNCDVEVHGAFCTSTSTTAGDYAFLQMKNTDNTVMCQIPINESDADTGNDNDIQWFPYPVYMKGKLQLEHTQVGADHAYSTVFYRKVNSDGIDHGWV